MTTYAAIHKTKNMQTRFRVCVDVFNISLVGVNQSVVRCTCFKLYLQCTSLCVCDSIVYKNPNANIDN